MSAAPSRILVVDDDDSGRYLKSHILAKHGYRVVGAANGEAALRQCREAAPDLVLLDVMLPDIDGVELCREIKAAFPGLAVLQTSAAVTSAYDRAASLVVGADSFLVEPIEPEELVATVKALLRMRAAEQELRRMNERLERAVEERTRQLTEAYQRLEEETAQRHQAEQVLWHTQKLDSVGQLTGGIAHDFNNLLAVIVASLEMIHTAVTGSKPFDRARVLRLLKNAELATERGAKMTRQLLAFARRSTLTPQAVRLADAITAHEPFLRRAVGETVTLHLSLPPDTWPCSLDPVQLEAALLNLVINARDAMPKGGRLDVVISNVSFAAAQSFPTGELPAGDYVCLRVSDTGTGMDADIAARVFEPFFTTKEVGRGTGLGLSQVYGFVKQSEGQIALETAPGRGSSFILYLPRSRSAPAALGPSSPESTVLPTGTETVLVVEDDAQVRALATATISDLGYHVLEASNGPAALEILQDGEPIDLLFSDVVLPNGMSGFELVHRARAMRTGLRALMTSGYANIQRPGDIRPDAPLLLKPYRREELARRLRSALD